jgi:hypothetical protein
MIGMYDFDGQPIPMWEWMALFWTEDRCVAATRIDDEVGVSTVWLGVDTVDDRDPPLIFETLVFGGPYNGVTWHTPNRHAALAAHDQAVATVRAGT